MNDIYENRPQTAQQNLSYLSSKAKTILVQALFFLVSISADAQVKLGFTVIPSLSRFPVENYNLSDAFIYPVSFGLSIIEHKKRFMLSTGVFHFTQGRKFRIKNTIAGNPLGSGDYIDINFRAKTIMIPFIINYKLIENSKSTLFGGIGLNYGYIYSEDWDPDPNVFFPFSFRYSSKYNIFHEMYVGLNVGVGYIQKISDKLNLQIRPNCLYQFREIIPRTPNIWTNRMMTWALDVGIFFPLKK